MKIIRTSKGITIELDWTEAEAFKAWLECAMDECSETAGFLERKIFDELDEILTEEGT